MSRARSFLAGEAMLYDQASGWTVSTLLQDVWIGMGQRQRGLRLGPYGLPRARVLVHPPAGVSLDTPALRAFMERLAGTLEVMALESPAAKTAGSSAPGGRAEAEELLDTLAERWPPPLPLVVCGIGEGVATGLALAARADVRGLALVGPRLPAGEVGASELALLAAKPLLVVLPRDAADLAPAFSATQAPAWPLASWLLPPGDIDTFLEGALAATVAAWASAAARG